MGLDCTHGAFHGSYSAFNRFRQSVARVCGGSFPPHKVEIPDGMTADCAWWDDEVVPTEHDAACRLFLMHSDCDGEISPEDCAKVAAFLRWCAPLMTEPATGHLERNGATMEATALRFAAGCGLAASLGESLVFA